MILYRGKALTTQQLAALKVLRDRGPLTTTGVAEALERERHAMRSVLLALSSKGLVKRDQNSNPVTWRVTN